MERLAITIRGVVQGVGFRPFVSGLAARLGLAGFVQNTVGGVVIEVEGEPASLARFLAELTGNPPPLAHIDHIEWDRQSPAGYDGFRIRASETAADGPVFVSPDAATCADCLAELFDPADRRYRYPFLNCTNCGPRLTIVTDAPYDRSRTTMAGFTMCPACRAEYENPADRRFHAQPTCCPACGPHLRLLDARGEPIPDADPLGYFAAAVRDGRIGAIKGLGGYHLACDARSSAAVAELRRRKHRDEKPFALLVADEAAVAELCEAEPAELALLRSPARPIVLVRKRPGNGVADGVAPGNPLLGLMLPYTPLHQLLMRELGGSPLVMTSGNRSDEPIAFDDRDAATRLAGVADLFLTHDRPIHVRCDDSVTRITGGAESPLRRSRGYAPQPVSLPAACPQPILAVGGQLKATFALGRDRHAILSHHLGDLDHFDAYEQFVKDVALYERLFRVAPRVVARDLHPDYATTHYARDRAAEGMTVVAVQHHHAHLASCMAENGLTGPVIGVTFDGTGYGTDGAVWGGEFLVGDYREFRRAAHLRYVGMPGGERAVREPWRMALAHLLDAGLTDDPLRDRVPAAALGTAGRMLERGLNAPPTSSAGRLFDAVASLAGVRDRVSYEGQAAVELEWLAESAGPDSSYPFELAEVNGVLVADTRPLIRAAAGDRTRRIAPAVIARRFHSALVELVAAVCGRLREATGLADVALSGGVFMNALLTREAGDRLRGDGFRVHRHRLVPPGDGGLSLGQLAVAAHHETTPR